MELGILELKIVEEEKLNNNNNNNNNNSYIIIYVYFIIKYIKNVNIFINIYYNIILYSNILNR